MACAIRGNNDIKGIKLPDERGGAELQTKISMFADNAQLFNKDERSLEKSFDILSKYEKASGSRINYNKTKAIFVSFLLWQTCTQFFILSIMSFQILSLSTL
jgi:hypothetical protein